MAMDIKLELRKALVFWIKVPQKLAVIGESKWFDLDPMIWGLFFNKIRKMVSWSVTGSTHKHPREEGLPLRFAVWTPGWSLEHWFKARTWTQDTHSLTRFPKYQDKRRGFLLLFCWSSLTEILGEELVKQTGSITVTPQPKKRHTRVSEQSNETFLYTAENLQQEKANLKYSPIREGKHSNMSALIARECIQQFRKRSSNYKNLIRPYSQKCQQMIYLCT